jgi:ABC-type antimicrobial peptide transport system permease subunit
MRVLGVVGDISAGGPPDMYVPVQQRYWPTVTLLVRRIGERSLAGDLRSVVTSMNGGLTILAADTVDGLRNGPVETRLRIAAAVASSVGAVGLLLAAIGIYGVTMYAVTMRTREIGIRLALGAGHGDVVGMVLRQGMILVAIGSAIGFLLSLGVGQVLMTRGFGHGLDVVTIMNAILLFAATGLVACYVPVRRAARLQAMEALRYE